MPNPNLAIERRLSIGLSAASAERIDQLTLRADWLYVGDPAAFGLKREIVGGLCNLRQHLLRHIIDEGLLTIMSGLPDFDSRAAAAHFIQTARFEVGRGVSRSQVDRTERLERRRDSPSWRALGLVGHP